MPTYEYECTECGKVFDLFQSITEPARRRLKKADPKACDCNASVKRLIGTGGGIIFKGSGFYQTDYRSDSYKKGQEAEKGSSSTKSDSSSTKSDSDSTKSDSSSTKSDSDSTKKDTKTEKKKDSSKREPAGCSSKT